MPTYRLQQPAGTLRFELSPGRRLVLGRSPGCDLIVPDASVSRQHAELEASGEALQMRDLGSANGTRVNGVRQAAAALRSGDRVAFGAVEFEVMVPSAAARLAEGLPAGTDVRTLVALPLTAGHARQEAVLQRLLDVAAGLAGEFALDELLRTTVELAFDQVDADRVALLLMADDGTLQAGPTANRQGEQPVVVPRTIAERALRDRAAVVTASAQEDARFQSGSVAMQSVRGALCVPLLAAGRALGILYADSITRSAPFSDEEAHAFMAFAGLAAVAVGRVRFAEEARREREVRASFERFFAPSIAARIAADPLQGVLDGARRRVAVLFSDIRGFTPLSERLPPEETAALLGDYFATMVDLVFDHGGTLDKFIGDAVMAVWGAPLPDPDAADRALAAALAMREELARRNQERVRAGRPPIEAGIGLSFGEAFAGNVGSERRLEYTVVGDTVNLASRLCELAGPGEILVTEGLVAALTTRPPMGEGEALAIRGRDATVRVYRMG